MFITLEGIDASGKSTQCQIIRDWLIEQGHSVFMVREPGGTVISEGIRTLLLDKKHSGMDATTELLLFSAARSQLVFEEIRPALERGDIVLADRFFDSTTAYQGYGRGLDLDTILRINDLASHGLTPDLTFFLDIDYDESIRRANLQARDNDRIESASRSFFESVRNGYRSLATNGKDRFVIVDGAIAKTSITAKIIEHIQRKL
jgi:dTMP kinase